MGFSFGSRIDEKGCKLTSARVAICQSFSSLCGVHINHRGPQLTVILRANSVVISHAITQIAQWDPRTQWSYKSSPPLCSLLLSFSSIILRWRVESSTVGSFLLLRGELRKQARASVMLVSLQGGEEMSCSTAKDDHLRSCGTRFPSGSHRDKERAGAQTNELGLADVPQWWKCRWWQTLFFTCIAPRLHASLNKNVKGQASTKPPQYVSTCITETNKVQILCCLSASAKILHLISSMKEIISLWTYEKNVFLTHSD